MHLVMCVLLRTSPAVSSFYSFQIGMRQTTKRQVSVDTKPAVGTGGRHGFTEIRELFRYRNADRVQVFSLRDLRVGAAEVWIRHKHRNRLERSELAGTFTERAEAFAFIEARRELLTRSGWKHV